MKFLRPIILLATGAALLVTLASAQASGKPAGEKNAAPANASMPPVKSSPQIEKLAKMISGRWRVAETWDANDMLPKGGQGQGYAVIWTNSANLWIEEQYHSTGPLGPFAGHGVIWWDDKAQGYKSIWCDNMTPGGCTVANGLGKWDGKNAVFDDQQESMGKQETSREVFAPVDDSSFTLTMSGGEKGGPMKRALVLTYTNDGGPGSAPAASSNSDSNQ